MISRASARARSVTRLETYVVCTVSPSVRSRVVLQAHPKSQQRGQRVDGQPAGAARPPVRGDEPGGKSPERDEQADLGRVQGSGR